MGRVVVVPAVTRQLPGGKGYALRLYPAWEDFPSGDIEADTRRMMVNSIFVDCMP
jgi:KDO2-lipid IV(A) lauroyltransferase